MYENAPGKELPGGISIHEVEYSLAWSIEKCTHGIDDYDLGELQEINNNVVITEKGIIDLKRLLDRFDGYNVMEKRKNSEWLVIVCVA